MSRRRFTMPTVADFTAKYGSYEDGHKGRPIIQGMSLGTAADGTPEVTYALTYSGLRNTSTTSLVHMYVTSGQIRVMREWLATQPIMQGATNLHLEGEVLRRIEQYYGSQGLEQFIYEWHQRDMELECEHRAAHDAD